MLRVYIASPYSHPIKRVRTLRFQCAMAAVAEMFKRGYDPYSPIVHWHTVAEFYGIEKGFKTFKIINEEEILRSEQLGILDITGVSDSNGVHMEARIAREAEIEITCIRLSRKEYPIIDIYEEYLRKMERRK